MDTALIVQFIPALAILIAIIAFFLSYRNFQKFGSILGLEVRHISQRVEDHAAGTEIRPLPRWLLGNARTIFFTDHWMAVSR